MNVVEPFMCCYCLVKYCYYCKVRHLASVHSTPFRLVAAFSAGICLKFLSSISAPATWASYLQFCIPDFLLSL